MYIREMLRGFEPYSWEPSTASIARSVGLRPSQIIRLDTNTSPLTPVSVLKWAERRIHRLEVNNYPDTSYSRLRDAIASYVGCSADSVVPTNGADEAIDIIARIFLDKGSVAIASTPTYGYFRIVTELQGGTYVKVPRLGDFSDDVDAILSRVDRDSRLIFLCSPNNPTGNSTPTAIIERICKEVEIGVVVDEAYYEYCGRSAAHLIKNYPNLMIVRTLSKAFGLAGIRVGYIIAAEETAHILNKARPPNSLGVVNVAIAERALRFRKYVERAVRLIKAQREYVKSRLDSISGIYVYPSEANFLLVRFDGHSAERVYEGLLRHGIVVRNLSQNLETKNCLRITIGNPDQNEKVLAAIKKVMGI